MEEKSTRKVRYKSFVKDHNLYVLIPIDRSLEEYEGLYWWNPKDFIGNPNETKSANEVVFDETEYGLILKCYTYWSEKKRCRIQVAATLRFRDYSAIPPDVLDELGELTSGKFDMEEFDEDKIKEILSKGYRILSN